MPLLRPQILRVCLSLLHHQPSATANLHAHTHKLNRPFKLHPSVRLPLTRTLASHSSTTEADHHGGHDGHDGGHESKYDPPGGWWLGVPPGETYQKEGWEDSMFYGYIGALLVGVVFYAYKPDTSIQTWALEEARRRLEAEGILEDPAPGPKVGWDMSSYRPGGKDSSWPAEWADGS